MKILTFVQRYAAAIVPMVQRCRTYVEIRSSLAAQANSNKATSWVAFVAYSPASNVAGDGRN